jgi:hypothetical protein
MDKLYESKILTSFSSKSYTSPDSNLVSELEVGYDGIPIRIMIEVDFLHIANDHRELQKLIYNTPNFTVP